MVLKRVEPPSRSRHPRGWDTSLSHERKLRSYDVERCFYERYAGGCRPPARVPVCHATRSEGGRWLFLLEDLDGAGFAGRRQDPGEREITACLRWLAEFHAAHLGVAPDGLWPEGTYWHLATRPDELAAIEDPRLKAAAHQLDAQLAQCRFRTFVHGDAKVANFCFSSGEAVAAVDFQYVGGGCGIKDVAYFLSSCLTDVECEALAPGYLDTYFGMFAESARAHHPGLAVREIEAEWRALYPIAWADFYRFLAGWSPDHWKIHGYSDRLTRQVLDALGQ